MLNPGSTIGIIGGGQLGRMLAMAAASMGYHTHVFCPEANSPASQVADTTTVAAYDNRMALVAFMATVDVITFEFENIPTDCLEMLAQQVAVHPSSHVLATCRHRLQEKDFINAQGISTAPYRAVRSLEELEAALNEIGTPAILKTCEFGYDGKGQVRIDGANEAQYAWEKLNTSEAILEGFVPFEKEVSVIVARSVDGEVRCFPTVENRHKNHVLDITIAPAQVADATTKQAEEIAKTLASALNVVGLLAVEMFVLKDGALIVNELAPRPHNSGHWTLEGAATSQFAQHIRAICGWPLGSAALLCDTEMKNLIGEDVHHWESHIQNAFSHLHLYGKTEVRAGRKMGHVTTLKPKMNLQQSTVAAVGDVSDA